MIVLKKFIISPPFGNYIHLDCATSVAGTFTAKRRKGLIRQAIKTIRPIKGGWVNKIGFRNKGIKNVTFRNDQIYSVAGLEGDGDWSLICDTLPEDCMVEANAGCPNAGSYSISMFALRLFVQKFQTPILKVSPTDGGMLTVCKAYEIGFRTVHIANTIPVEQGGESGQRLKPISLHMIEETKRLFPNITVIGGGGIYSPEDLKDYVLMDLIQKAATEDGKLDFDKLEDKEKDAFAMQEVLVKSYERALGLKASESNYFADLSSKGKKITDKYAPAEGN